MIKRILFLIAITLSASINTALSSNIDSSYTIELTPFNWTPISDVDKVMQYENQKDLTRRSIEQAKAVAENYIRAVSLMNDKEYITAIKEFKAAMKRYKRAKLSPDAMNFIHVNMALSYANTGNKEDLVQAKRLLNIITKKAYDDNKWAYNIAIAHNLTGKQDEASSILTKTIKKDEFYFQAYITLEAIYRNSGNENYADKIAKKMNSAKEKLNKKNQKTVNKKTEKKVVKAKKEKIEKGKKPDITNLKIVTSDDHLQFNKIENIDERNIIQIQEGVGYYNKGVESLSNREHKNAQKPLKDAEKKLKRGKITDDGLNFSRANLVISYLATEDKKGIAQAKRYLKSLTSKLFNSRAWTYNMGVAYYQFAFMSARKNKKTGERKWTTPAAEENLKISIKLFQKTINKDKLYLPAYENLIYIYREQGEEKKAISTGKALKKSRLKLMTSYSKNEQLEHGGDTYVFRLNLGTFGSFDTPIELFEEPNVITIPITENKTAYLSGLFYSLDEALNYKEKMEEIGYGNSFIVAYTKGKILEF